MDIYVVKRGSQDYFYSCIFCDVDMTWHLVDLLHEEMSYESYKYPKDVEKHFEELLKEGRIDDYYKV